MNEQQLAQVYEMVDNVPFSRQKKNIGRDFSDGLMMAELIHHYYPKKVQIHNYPATNTVSKKIENWNTLNFKVLKKLGLGLGPQEISQIANIKPLAIEKLLYKFLMKYQRPEQQVKISNKLQNIMDNSKMPENQNSGIKSKGSGLGLSIQNKKGQFVNIKRQQQDSEEILELIDKIDYEYARLIKLQQMSRLKDDVIKNLQKKVEKIIFS